MPRRVQPMAAISQIVTIKAARLSPRVLGQGMDWIRPHAAAQGRSIDTADVIALLREVYADGIGTREEAEELISFDQSLGHTADGWVEFFATTIADHVVRRREPSGIVSDENATWLIRSLSSSRRLATEGGFGAIMRMLEISSEVSPLLAAYTIGQMRFAVIAGSGPAIGARKHFSRTIDSADVVLLERILQLSGGASVRSVSRLEAEALFDLHDAVAGAENEARFVDLFFAAIANHLLASVGLPSSSRLVAPAPGGTVMLAAEESAWLSSRIMRDGRPTVAEYSLLRAFGGESSGIDFLQRRSLDYAA